MTSPLQKYWQISIVRCFQAIFGSPRRWVFGLFLGIGLSLWLHSVLRPSPAVAQYPSAPLLQEARSHYRSGQYQLAAPLFEQALQTQTQFPLNRALTLSYLALTYQNLGQVASAKTAIAESLALLPRQGDKQTLSVRAQIFNAHGQLQLLWGQPETALTSWQTAERDYQSLNDSSGIIGSQINQVQALRSLGLYRRAQTQISEITAKLATQPNSPQKVASLRSLGDILRVVGDLAPAKHLLESSLALAQELRSPQEVAATQLSLGTLELALGRQQINPALPATATETALAHCPSGHLPIIAQNHYQTALNYYQQSAALSATPLVQAQARLNQLPIQLAQKQSPPGIDTLITQLSNLPSSRSAIYAQVNLAKNLLCINHSGNPNQAIQLLQTAAQQAKALQDHRAQSYAIGTLGQVYESQGQSIAAQEATKEALTLAQQIQADDVAYQWQWQLGRLLNVAGERSQALAYYKVAIDQLQNLRSDLIALNTDVQFSFRESVEPAYRQFVSLLLQSPTQTDLLQARRVIEALQLAELDNFFRDACSDATPILVDQLTDVQDPDAAVLYPIILRDRLDIILKLPRQKTLHHYSINRSTNEIQATLDNFHRQLVEPHTLQASRKLGKQVYDWLIQPAEVVLAQASVKTLVFVLDGELRNVPMSALYDGNQYLIEKYAIALTPGLQLLSPKPLKQVQVNAITGGLSLPRQEFSPLPNVKTELATIGKIVPTKVSLLDEAFTQKNLEQALQSVPVSIVHLATHGRFSSQAENTFILAYDDRVTVNELETILHDRTPQSQQEIELLVLSACETAAGDQRAALGLAGVAVRAGARSTLASLWKADDEVTARLIEAFYQRLYQAGGVQVNKAIALQEAQKMILQEPSSRHPRYWAPFVLLGNWL